MALLSPLVCGGTGAILSVLMSRSEYGLLRRAEPCLLTGPSSLVEDPAPWKQPLACCTSDSTLRVNQQRKKLISGLAIKDEGKRAGARGKSSPSPSPSLSSSS